MTYSSDMVNWDSVFNESENFQKNSPFKFGFIENFFNSNFYNQLYQSYPSFETFTDGSNLTKTQLVSFWGDCDETNNIVSDVEDSKYSSTWNSFKHYAHSEEFLENIRKFSQVSVSKLKQFNFIGYRKGGFQLPHIHNVGPTTIIMLLYFSKGWEPGDPGGTYLASDTDESKIIFEPYNLDNTCAIFHDSPFSAHGVRYIKKNIERRGVQLVFEGFDDKDGWSSTV